MSLAIIRKIANNTHVQAGLTIFWILMIPVALITGLINSVGFVSVLSLWALVGSHGAWWAASKEEDE